MVFRKTEPKNSASSNDIFLNGGKDDFGALCGCCSELGSTVGRKPEIDACLGDDFIDDEEFK